MLHIGLMNDLLVDRKVDFGFYLSSGEEDVLLPAKYAPPGLKPGSRIEVFIYTDSEDRPIATTLKPRGMLGDYCVLKVKDLARFGAFFDWGLEKDLLVPVSEQGHPVSKGESHVVKICLDGRSGRLYGTTRIDRTLEKDILGLVEGDEVRLLVYHETPLGFQAIINGRHGGLLHRDEVFEQLHIGEEKTGYIARIRPDGKIDLVLKKPGFASVKTSAEKILFKLMESGGFLPYTDKTPPGEIQGFLAMSKKEFKRSAGNLMKAGKIRMDAEGIHLKS